MVNIYAKNVDGMWFGVAYDGEQIFATTFGSSSKEITMKSLLHSLPRIIALQCSEESSVFAERVVSSLRDMYDGKEISGNFSLATKHLSSYFCRVVEVVSLIPLGYASSYCAVAAVAGGSARAVGRIMAMNPFAPIVPCHRVVGSDFALCGYGGGLPMKLAFLEREKRGFTSKQEIPVNGRKLQVFPVELVLEKVGKGKC